MKTEPFQEKKIWGEVTHLLLSPEVGISHLTVTKNSFCSLHRHRQRDNHFMLLRGQVRVFLFGEGEEPTEAPTEIHFLIPNQTYCVEAGVWHQFMVDLCGQMVEIYTPTNTVSLVEFEDIDRYTLGGKYEH